MQIYPFTKLARRLIGLSFLRWLENARSLTLALRLSEGLGRIFTCARWLAAASTVGFERNEEGHYQQATFEQDKHPGACARNSLVVPVRSKHTNQAQKQGRPTAEGYEHRPVPYPDVVSEEDRQARDEQQDARKVDDRRDLRVVEMWLHKRELGHEHGDHGGAEERCDLL